MKTKFALFGVLYLYLFNFSVIASIAESKLTVKEKTELKSVIGSIKRGVMLFPEERVSAIRTDNELKLHFYQPVGRVQVSIHSYGKLIFDDAYEISVNDILIPIHLIEFQQGQSLLEITLCDRRLYSMF